MKISPRNYTIRRRKDCQRYELIIRSPYGRFYGGLHTTKKKAEETYEREWLGTIHPSPTKQTT